MTKDSAQQLLRELLSRRGAIRQPEGHFMYSLKEDFSKTQKVTLPAFLAEFVHLSDLQEHAIRLSFCSSNVSGVRTRLNFKLNSTLHSLRDKLMTENEVGLAWGDHPAGFQFFLSKDYLHGQDFAELEAIEKELLVLGAGLFEQL